MLNRELFYLKTYKLRNCQHLSAAKNMRKHYLCKLQEMEETEEIKRGSEELALLLPHTN